MIRLLGALIGAPQKGDALAARLERDIDAVRRDAGGARPRVYFEEWDDPLITGIGWVSELIEIAGGVDCFAYLRGRQAAKDRIICGADVIAAMPDVIVASWCGKKVSREAIRNRPGWDVIPAVANDRIVEIKSPLILQPGPAALTDGLAALRAAIAAP